MAVLGACPDRENPILAGFNQLLSFTFPRHPHPTTAIFYLTISLPSGTLPPPMITFSLAQSALVGEAGSLAVLADDVVTYKLAMLIEGECAGLGPSAAARKYDYTKQRYFQIKERFLHQGALGLQDLPRGPKSNYRRTDELVRQVIRYRFLDPEASAAVIGQKLHQNQYPISRRSIERVIADYGLQKKTLRP
jgi:hypothetical protein